MNTPISLILVDDHFLVRAGLIGSLSREPSVDVVAECDSGEEAVEAFRKLRPDVVLMDYRLGGMNGFQATRAILTEFPGAKIIALTNFDGEDDIHRAIQAGVRGYLSKSVRRKELLAAIHQVASGESYYPDEIRAKMEQRLTRSDLSSQELKVLARIAGGRSNKEIADDLSLSEATVKFHVGSILKKLEVADRTQAILLAFHRGIIHLE